MMETEVRTPQTEFQTPPLELTPKIICRWSKTYKALVDSEGKKIAGVLNRKAEIFLENNCIEYDNDLKLWHCWALKGYNTTNYLITSGREGFVCDCQGFKTRQNRGDRPICSHILAVIYWLKRKHWRERSMGEKELEKE